MLAMCPLEVVNRLGPYHNKDMISADYIKGDYNALVYLNANLKNKLLEAKRMEVTYEHELEKAFYIEDLYKN